MKKLEDISRGTQIETLLRPGFMEALHDLVENASNLLEQADKTELREVREAWWRSYEWPSTLPLSSSCPRTTILNH